MNKANIIILMVLLGAITLQSCKKEVVSEETAAKFEKLKWVLGEWESYDEQNDKRTIEKWEEYKGYILSGSAVVVEGGKETFSEKLKLSIKNDEIYYSADVPENKGPIYFKVTEVADDHFKSENPEHDYPKQIEYYQKNDGQRMTARTLGNGKRVDYNYVRLK